MILCMFQDRIYWTDRDRAAVFMANRLTGQDIHTLAENLNDPHDLVVFHQLRQPQGVCAMRSMIEGLCMMCVSVHFPPPRCDCVSRVASLRPRFPPWIRVDPGTWINDGEACDCGGVIKALGAAVHSHICQSPASIPSLLTGQSRFELNWTKLLIMNVMVVLCVFPIPSSYKTCLS